MYPLWRRDDRALPSDYRGLVVTCDVDKTYLDTDFESPAGLLQLPLEWAEDKRTVAGMGPVLRGLRHGTGERNAQVPFYFLTASPPFMVRVFWRKMLLDYVQADGITCKDWKAVLVRRRPAWLKRQLAYKLCALLHQRSLLPPGAAELLIGDDTESDALAYALYADLIAGRMGGAELARVMRRHGCDAAEVREALSSLDALSPPGDRVVRICIYCAKGTDPARFAPFSRDLAACASAFQLALRCALDNMLPAVEVVECCRDLAARSVRTPQSCAAAVADCLRRGMAGREELAPLARDLQAQGLLPGEMSDVRPDPLLTPPSREARGGRWTPEWME